MKFKKIHEREENREISRRALIGWMTAAGACLSVPVWKVKEIIEGTHGKAFAAGSQAARRSLRVDFGVGGLAWMTQVFPRRTLGEGSNGNSYLFEGQGRLATGTDRPLFLSPAGELAMAGLEGRAGTTPTMLLAGNGETHTRLSTSLTTLASGSEVHAAGGVMQIANTHLLPVLNVNGTSYGQAPGSPDAVQLNNAAAMVTTFKSAATAAGGILFDKPDAELFNANMTALLKLKKATDKPTYDRGIKAAQTSGMVVGLDIASLITPTPARLAEYGQGIGSGGDGRIQSLIQYFAVAERMIELALVSGFNTQVFNDDPHGAFNNIPQSQQIALSIGRVLNAFWTKMANTVDPLGTGQTLAQETVLHITGDTLKNTQNPAGWGDGENGGHSTWIWGAGRLFTGEFGRFNLGQGNFDGYDAVTGDVVPGRNGQANSTNAAQSVLYAIGNDTNLVRNLGGGQGSPGVERLDVDG